MRLEQPAADAEQPVIVCLFVFKIELRGSQSSHHAGKSFGTSIGTGGGGALSRQETTNKIKIPTATSTFNSNNQRKTNKNE